MLIIFSKKFITLSYAYYLLSKALIKQKDKINAMIYLERAAEIAKRYLGNNDKITITYQNKLQKLVSTLKMPSPIAQHRPLTINTEGLVGGISTMKISPKEGNIF